MNKTTFSVLGFTLAGVLALILPARVQAQAPHYTVTVLSNPSIYDSFALGINDSGQVVGYSSGNVAEAVVWNGTTPTVLTSLGNTFGSDAEAINASGQIAGVSDGQAVIWNGTTPTALTGLGGSGQYASAAIGINASGQAVGYSYTTGNAAQDAVVWNGTTPTVLNGLGGSTGSAAYGINASGQAVGYSYTTGNAAQDAVVWNGTTPTILGSVGGGSVAYRINASGQVVGTSNQDAVEWNGTTATVVGSKVSDIASYACGINDSGQVLEMLDSTGYLYTGGQTYNLNSILVPGSGVTDIQIYGTDNINDFGQIAADGVYEGGEVVVLLTPTPEPGSATLLLTGLLAMALRRRRAAV